jgi:hypothetical protein
MSTKKSKRAGKKLTNRLSKSCYKLGPRAKNAESRHVMTKQTKPQSKKQTGPSPLERDYLQTFIPRQLPYQGLYTDEDSLEQPSELMDVPSISVPSIEG